MEEALTNHLLAQAGLVALVGQRITWARRPQGSTLPAIVLHVISRQPQYTMEAASGLASRRIQVDCWADSFAGAKGAAREVAAALSGARMTVGGVAFQGGFQEGERDSFEQGSGGEQLYRVSMDFIIWTGED